MQNPAQDGPERPDEPHADDVSPAAEGAAGGAGAEPGPSGGASGGGASGGGASGSGGPTASAGGRRGKGRRHVTVTKKDLVHRIADATGETKVVVKTIVQMLLDEMTGELARGHRIEFRDFGVFEVHERQARLAQNPRTLEKVDVPPKRVVKFKPGRVMRDRVGEPPTDGEARA